MHGTLRLIGAGCHVFFDLPTMVVGGVCEEDADVIGRNRNCRIGAGICAR